MRMRAVLLSMLLGVNFSAQAESDFRPFTAGDRSIEARVIKVMPEKGMVELELRNKQRKKIKSAIFNEEDQAYIRDWFAVSEFMSQRFKIEPEKNVLDTQSELIRDTVRRITKQICYDIEISNRSTAKLDGLSLEYNIFFEQEELGRGKNIERDRVIYGNAEIAPLQSRKNKIIKSQVFEIYNQRLGGGYDYYSDGTPTNQSGKTKGIWVKVHLKTPSGLMGTRDLFLPQTLEKQNTWKTESR